MKLHPPDSQFSCLSGFFPELLFRYLPVLKIQWSSEFCPGWSSFFQYPSCLRLQLSSKCQRCPIPFFSNQLQSPTSNCLLNISICCPAASSKFTLSSHKLALPCEFSEGSVGIDQPAAQAGNHFPSHSYYQQLLMIPSPEYPLIPS